MSWDLKTAAQVFRALCKSGLTMDFERTTAQCLSSCNEYFRSFEVFEPDHFRDSIKNELEEKLMFTGPKVVGSRLVAELEYVRVADGPWDKRYEGGLGGIRTYAASKLRMHWDDAGNIIQRLEEIVSAAYSPYINTSEVYKKGYDVAIVCRSCLHNKWVENDNIIDIFGSLSPKELGRRLRCNQCFRKNVCIFPQPRLYHPYEQSSSSAQ